MPVPSYYAGTGRPANVGTSSGGYTGLGTVYQYGHQNPGGPMALATGQYGASPSQLASGSSSQSSTPSPQNSAAMAFLNSVVSGQELPYGQQQQDAMYGQASGMNAAAEAAQNQEAEGAASAGGASPTDPSYQNQMRQNMARRQTGNQRTMGDIQAKAGSENFGARTGAAGAILGAEQNALDRQERQNSKAMGMLSGMYGYGGGGQSSGGNNFGGTGGMWQYSGAPAGYR